MSSSKSMSAASLATSVPRTPHGYPDIGLAQRGGVIDAITGHGNDMA